LKKELLLGQRNAPNLDRDQYVEAMKNTIGVGYPEIKGFTLTEVDRERDGFQAPSKPGNIDPACFPMHDVGFYVVNFGHHGHRLLRNQAFVFDGHELCNRDMQLSQSPVNH
jgi:hypothetical protein